MFCFVDLSIWRPFKSELGSNFVLGVGFAEGIIVLPFSGRSALAVSSFTGGVLAATLFVALGLALVPKKLLMIFRREEKSSTTACSDSLAAVLALVSGTAVLALVAGTAVLALVPGTAVLALAVLVGGCVTQLFISSK